MLDRPTIESHLKRALDERASLEQLGRDKRAQFERLATQVEHVVGALEYSAIVIAGLKRDLAELDAPIVAAKEAARLAAESAAKITNETAPPT